jgi:hypothetical protein
MLFSSTALPITGYAGLEWSGVREDFEMGHAMMVRFCF